MNIRKQRAERRGKLVADNKVNKVENNNCRKRNGSAPKRLSTAKQSVNSVYGSLTLGKVTLICNNLVDCVNGNFKFIFAYRIVKLESIFTADDLAGLTCGPDLPGD